MSPLLANKPFIKNKLKTLTVLTLVVSMTFTLPRCTQIRDTSHAGTDYQQCKGLQHNIQRLQSEDINDNINQFRMQQQLDNFRQQYKRKSCGQVLSN